ASSSPLSWEPPRDVVLERGQGPDSSSTFGNRWASRAFLTASESKLVLSVNPNFSSRALKSILIVPCSTHGRVASAARTRSDQPVGQVMPGTRKAAWNGASTESWVEPSSGVPCESDRLQPIMANPTAKRATAERNRRRIAFSYRLCPPSGG